MLIKYFLHYDNTKYELKDDDLYNWDEIRCSYKRDNYDGVVRSFTSQFVFVNRARDILLKLYLRDRYNAKVNISLHTITDRWGWEEKFNCPLDFSTVSMEKYKFKINAIDNSLAALIKANKSTKFEFKIGSEIKSDTQLRFDRIPMVESVLYEFTQGSQDEDSADIEVAFNAGELPFVGNVGKDVAINGVIDWRDDQTDEISAYLLKAVKDVTVTFEYEIEWRRDLGLGEGVKLFIETKKGLAIESSQLFGTLIRVKSLGTYTSPDELPEPDASMNHNDEYAVVSGLVWILQYGAHGWSWKSTSKAVQDYFTETLKGSFEFPLQTNNIVRLKSGLYNTTAESSTIHFIKTQFKFSWKGRGEPVSVDLISPRRAGRALIEKIVDGRFGVDVWFSEHDSRIKNTWLMAAESARDISEAKFYSSFNEFCEWMSTVFGYVYYIGPPRPSKYKWTRVCGQIEGSPWYYYDETYVGPINTDNIVYIPGHAKFLYHDEEAGKLYSEWSGCEMYNDPATGHPRTDTLFRIIELSNTELYYFDEYVSGYLYPTLYDHYEDYIGDGGHTLYFVHRSEVLNMSTEIRKINCRDVKYHIDTSAIYSAITVGYDKKDYNNTNGRNEFNFNNTYSTGCNISDKTLSLISKYRADCYGMEFAVQKRGADTIDSSSDSDVFFVICSGKKGELVPDRTIPITNSLTNASFNGAFSPMACIRANAGLIGLQAEEMTLKFASSTGNSEIVIDGEPMSADITLKTPLATSGWIEFTTDEVDELVMDDVIEVVDEEGIVYRGYLKELDIKYAKTEAAKYKLIVKDIEL